MDEEVKKALDDFKELFLELRRADLEAVRLTRSDLTRRLDGFPQQYATATQMEALRAVIQNLVGDSLSREVYETNHKSLETRVTHLMSDKLGTSVFDTFLENYRLEGQRNSEERQAVATTLATIVGTKTGQSSTWFQIGSLLAGIATLLAIVVLLATHVPFK